jgi:hypothetical protein
LLKNGFHAQADNWFGLIVLSFVYEGFNNPSIRLKLTHNFGKKQQGGGAAGQWKHLEFPAGTDQRKIVTKVGSIKARHLFSQFFLVIL